MEKFTVVESRRVPGIQGHQACLLQCRPLNPLFLYTDDHSLGAIAAIDTKEIKLNSKQQNC